jgi:hypothetical protein
MLMLQRGRESSGGRIEIKGELPTELRTQSGRLRRVGSMNDLMSALPPKADIGERNLDVRFVPCVDGSELARTFFTSAASVGAAMCSACLRGSHDRWP